ADFDKTRPERGHLQIVQGAVGSGKSLFMQRYYDFLQPEEDARRTRWSFIDFNSAPPNLADAQDWLCSKFAEDFERRNSDLDLFTMQCLRGIFSRNIQKRKGVYETLRISSPEAEQAARGADLRAWQDSPKELARGIADYTLGSRQEILVVVL